MDLPGIWGWLVLAVLAVGVGALAKIRNGWTVIFAVVFALSALTFGYSIGFDEGVDRASAVLESPRKACEIEYMPDAAAMARRAIECNSAWQADRIGVREVTLSSWIGAGAMGLMIGSLMLVLMEVLPRFAAKSGTQVGVPQTDASVAERKPEQGGGPQGS